MNVIELPIIIAEDNWFSFSCSNGDRISILYRCHSRTGGLCFMINTQTCANGEFFLFSLWLMMHVISKVLNGRLRVNGLHVKRR